MSDVSRTRGQLPLPTIPDEPDFGAVVLDRHGKVYQNVPISGAEAVARMFTPSIVGPATWRPVCTLGSTPEVALPWVLLVTTRGPLYLLTDEASAAWVNANARAETES